MSVTIVIPFHRNLAQLGESLTAARRSMPDAEIIVAADGARDDCHPLAAAQGASVVVVPGPRGPAVARNRAAALATGDLLVFVDADVVPSPAAIPGLRDLMNSTPSVAAAFGAYDLHPREPGFMSQFKNLSHSQVHEAGSPVASTFWAGLGIVRTAAFRAVGGFDERFERPSVEDIDLGYRLVDAGYQIRLDPTYRGTHLKRWTLWNCVVTDIRARGIPWTQIIHRRGKVNNDLNTSLALRLSVITAYLAVAALLATAVTWWALAMAVALLTVLVLLNATYYRWFVRTRGLWFAARVVPVHLVHHLCNGVSFGAGTMLHLASRVGLILPGTLPTQAWSAEDARRAVPVPTERDQRRGPNTT